MKTTCAILFILGLVAIPATSYHGDSNFSVRSRHKRFTNRYEPDLWHKATVPYKVEPEVMKYIPEYSRAMKFIEELSCVRYIPWTKTSNKEHGLNHQNFLRFVNATGCGAYLPSEDSMKKAKGLNVSCCTLKSSCLHELGHNLGFEHEQQNPKRSDWMTVNPENAIVRGRAHFLLLHSSKYHSPWPFDTSTPMLYNEREHSISEKNTMTMKFPEIGFSNHRFFYFFMEMGDAYKCHERYACTNNQIKCYNDGYITVVRGRCRCRCPPGLDSDTGCQTILKTVTNTRWPKGQYSVLKSSTSNCSSTLNAGTVDISGMTSNDNNQHLQQSLCSRTIDDEDVGTSVERKFNWPQGSYCIIRKGGKCPTDFTQTSINFGQKTNRNYSGILPDGCFKKNKTFHICCLLKGFPIEPTHFPTDKPFALYKHEDQCQQVIGMHVTSKDVMYYSRPGDITITGVIPRTLTKLNNGLKMTECHYRPAEMNCGDVIVLNRTHMEAIIESRGEGHTDMECYWLIKGDNSDGTIVIETEEFNIPGNGNGSCEDKLVIKHNRIGQAGIEYCGQNPHNIRSIFDKVMVTFFTYSSNSKSSFRLKVRWVPNKDLCYNKADRGMSYDGHINYTRIYEPCISWSKATHCHHHPYNNEDLRQGLDHNYCRNPDNSPRPWCYTSQTGCIRNFCDVCGLETPFDRNPDCQLEIKSGLGKKGFDEIIGQCAKTFQRQLLPNPVPPLKPSEIKCITPEVPIDGKMIGQSKSIYKQGETVTYECVNSSSTVSTTCMTSGQWSPVISACRGCESNDILYNNTCYRLLNDGIHTSKTIAESICRSMGGNLPTPKSTQEANVIVKAGNGSWYVWLGVTDIDVEGQWLYKDGSQVLWTNWGLDQPSNADNKDCVMMYETGEWIVIGCDEHYAEVVCSFTIPETFCDDYLGEQRCQAYLSDNPHMCRNFPDFASQKCPKTCRKCKDNSITDDKSQQCNAPTESEAAIPIGVDRTTYFPLDTVTFQCRNNSCVFTSACNKNGQWLNVDEQCHECKIEYKLMNGGKQYLPTEARRICLDNNGVLAAPRNEKELIDVIALPFLYYAWIDINDKQNEGVWVYNDNTPVTWTSWFPGQPNSLISSKDCVITYTSGGWKDVRCTVGFGSVVCGVQVNAFLECSTTPNNTNVQVMSTRHSIEVGQQVTYKCSPNSYRVKGDETRVCLPTGELSGEQLECKEITCGAPKPPSGTTLVGQSKVKYVPGDTTTFRCNLGNTETTGYCLPSGFWDIPNIWCSSCGPNDTIVNDVCFRLLQSTSSYSQASVTCKNYGGYIAAPKNVQEQNMIKNITGKTIWMGITKYQPEGHWVYQDGSNITWTNWDHGEQNNYGTSGENCAAGNSRWIDVPCNYDYQAVCAIPVNSTCEDRMRNWCEDLVREFPSLCQILPQFSNINCQKTCGICQNKNIRCENVKNQDPTVAIETANKPSLSVGEFVEYKCVENSHRLSGDPIRSCLPSGQLTGHPLQCQAFTDTDNTVTGSTNTKSQNPVCEDRLGDDCIPLVSDHNNLCKTARTYMSDYCRKSCGVCTPSRCNVSSPNPNVLSSTTTSTIVMGETITYRCTNNTYKYTGDIVRACLKNGLLSGTPLQCHVCADRLGDDCISLLSDQPTLCMTQPTFMGDYCQKSCGVCTPSRCNVESPNPNVLSSTTTSTLDIGDTITYRCTNNTYEYTGDIVRACLNNGQLSGTPLQCHDCPRDFYKLNGGCHGFIQEMTSYSKAQEICFDLGGFIAAPRSPGEVDLFSAIAKGRDIFIDPKYAINWRGLSTDQCLLTTQETNCRSKHYFVCSIPKSDPYVCYNPRDRGASYNGHVKQSFRNHSSSGQKCLTWAETANCPDSPYKLGMTINNLDSNYCRNPDNSPQPWCYTCGCHRQPCDVCRQDILEDTSSDCWRQRENGICTRDRIKAKKECAATCSDVINNNGPGFYGDIVCGTPPVPSDGELVGQSRSKYHVGDVVTFKCTGNKFGLTSTCMTDGTWSNTHSACSECPMGYVMHNDTCFKHIKSKDITYNEAKTRCHLDGAQLPRPISLAESDYIHSLSPKNKIWLATRSAGRTNNFLWNDGNNVTWTNWDKDYPKGGDCVYIMDNSKWRNTLCDLPDPQFTLVCTTPKRNA